MRKKIQNRIKNSHHPKCQARVPIFTPPSDVPHTHRQLLIRRRVCDQGASGKTEGLRHHVQAGIVEHRPPVVNQWVQRRLEVAEPE